MSELSEQNRALVERKELFQQGDGSSWRDFVGGQRARFDICAETLNRLLDAARAEGPAPVSAPLDREGVARIIDPRAFKPTIFSGDPDWHPGDDNLRRINALTKADAILALSQQDQVGLTTPAVLGEPSADALRSGVECHGLDTAERVHFYEQDFYVLSNFSAFSIMWPVSAREGDLRFDTSEAVYHFEKFICRGRVSTQLQRQIAEEIRCAPSAHEAYKIAEANKRFRRSDWDQIKVGVMKEIIRSKALQHEYVRRKLLATGDRELVENSWRDDFWGWGPNRDGQNMLGKLWMELRAELRATPTDLDEPVSPPPAGGVK